MWAEIERIARKRPRFQLRIGKKLEKNDQGENET
jgi:hypothetical protein